MCNDRKGRGCAMFVSGGVRTLLHERTVFWNFLVLRPYCYPCCPWCKNAFTTITITTTDDTTNDNEQVEPVMKRVIGPYVFEGGGAKSLNYQSLARDLGRATLEIPFNIPPYFALIARALGILEGTYGAGDL